MNRITHPEIYKEMWWEAVKCAASGYQYIIMDLPLLFEAGVMVPPKPPRVITTVWPVGSTVRFCTTVLAETAGSESPEDEQAARAAAAVRASARRTLVLRAAEAAEGVLRRFTDLSARNRRGVGKGPGTGQGSAHRLRAGLSTALSSPSGVRA